MIFLDSIENWEQLERRVEKICDLSRVTDRETFRQALIRDFFKVKHPETDEWVSYRPSGRQQQMIDAMWDDMRDDIIQERGQITLQIKEYPTEARRFFKSLKLYPNILKNFAKGHKRKDIAKAYSEKTHRKERTIQRDIYSMVKIGLLKKTSKRGIYEVAGDNLYV